MLNIYWLKQFPDGPNLCGPYSDEMLSCIILAEDEEMARKIAASKALEEDHLGYEKDGNTEIRRKPSAWEDGKLTLCLNIGVASGYGTSLSRQMLIADTVNPS